MAPSILKSAAVITAVLATLSTATPLKAVGRRQDPSASAAPCINGNDAVICGAHGDSAGAITYTQGGTTYAIVGPSGTNAGYISTIGGAGPTGAAGPTGSSPNIPQVTGTSPGGNSVGNSAGNSPGSTGGEFFPIKASVDDEVVNDKSSVVAPLSTGVNPPATTLQTATTPSSTGGSPGGNPGGNQGASGGFGLNFPNSVYPMTCPVASPEGQKGYLTPGGSTSGTCQGESSWCTGDMTLYEVATDPKSPSSCGGINNVSGVNTDNDLVVALPIGMMDKASMCGKMVQIHNPASGKTQQAQVVDSCGGCQGRDLDMSHQLYDNLSGNRACGRIGGIQWYFLS